MNGSVADARKHTATRELEAAMNDMDRSENRQRPQADRKGRQAPAKNPPDNGHEDNGHEAVRQGGTYQGGTCQATAHEDAIDEDTVRQNRSPGQNDAAASPLTPDIQTRIGVQLQALYSDLLTEETPDRFLKLLDDLDRKSQQR